MIVEVRPLPLKKWHGKQGAEAFTQPHTIEALVDPETGRLATGLTEEEAERLGKKMGLDLSDTFTGSSHPFWGDKVAWVQLPNRTLILNTDNPKDYLKAKLLKSKSAPQVANSQKEYDEGRFPDATHIIYDEAEEIAVEAGKEELRMLAYSKISGLSQEDKAALLFLLTNRYSRKQSLDYLNVKLGEQIKLNPKEVLRILGMGGKEVKLRARILELLEKNILTKQRGTICYMGEMIALDYEDAVRWFNDPQNSQVKLLIFEQLEQKNV